MSRLPFADETENTEEILSEDYFFGAETGASRQKVYALVIYDMIDNKNAPVLPST